MKTTRRTFLGCTAAFASAASIASATPTTVSDTVSDLFTRWIANPDSRPGADYSGYSQEQLDALYADYHELQTRIINATPTTAKEVAQQYFVATDGGASEIPEELFERFRAMAWEGSL